MISFRWDWIWQDSEKRMESVRQPFCETPVMAKALSPKAPLGLFTRGSFKPWQSPSWQKDCRCTGVQFCCVVRWVSLGLEKGGQASVAPMVGGLRLSLSCALCRLKQANAWLSWRCTQVHFKVKAGFMVQNAYHLRSFFYLAWCSNTFREFT